MVSRQDDYRMRALRAGLCIHCGKGKLVTVTRCEKCRMKAKMWFAKWRLRKQAEKRESEARKSKLV